MSTTAKVILSNSGTSSSSLKMRNTRHVPSVLGD